MKNYGHTTRRTHAGAYLRARFRASCLVWCEVAAFLLLVRMRFLFGFSSRVGHNRYHCTDVPLQPDSPPDSVCRTQKSLFRTVPNRYHTHTHALHRFTSFHREPQLTKTAEQHYLTVKHQTTRIIREPQQRRSTPECRSSREQHEYNAATTSKRGRQQQQRAATEAQRATKSHRELYVAAIK